MTQTLDTKFAELAARLIQDKFPKADVTFTVYSTNAHSTATGGVTKGQAGGSPVTWYSTARVNFMEEFFPGFLSKAGDAMIFVPAQDTDGTAISFTPAMGQYVSFDDGTVWKVEALNPYEPGDDIVAWGLVIRKTG